VHITIFSDCHWFGPTPSEAVPEYGASVFYLGDNHEMKNIKKKDVSARIEEYNDFLSECLKTCTNVLTGNHEVSAGKDLCGVDVLKIEARKVGFVHGDLVLWEPKKSAKWRARKCGLSWFRIKLIHVKNLFRNKSGASALSSKQIELFSRFAKKHNVTTVVFGHTHPKKLIDETHEGIRLINVPRGRTKLFV